MIIYYISDAILETGDSALNKIDKVFSMLVC